MDPEEVQHQMNVANDTQHEDVQKPQRRLMAQWALVPGDIADGSHSYEGVLMETADLALERLTAEAAKEGKRLLRPVWCRVTVEAVVDDA